MNSQAVQPGPPRRGTLDALRPVAMAAALLVVLVLAAIVAAWLTGGNGFTLTVEKPTGGTLVASGISCGSQGSSCSTSGMDGQVVELRAEADAGYTFAGYTGDCVPGGRVLMDGPHRCGARFDRQPGADTPETPAAGSGRRWPLTLTPAEHGTIVTLEGHECGPTKKNCTVEVAEGTIVSLEVLPEPGHRVQSYTGDCVDGTANMTQARACGVVLVRGEGPTFVPKPKDSPSPVGQTARVPRAEPVREEMTPTPASTTPASTTPSTPPVDSVAPRSDPPKVDDRPAPRVEAPRVADKPAPKPELARPDTTPAAAPVVAREGDREAAEKLAQGDIQRVLKAYRGAYERMDVPGLKRLQPGLNVAVHELQFRDLKSVKYTFGGDPQIEDLDVEVGRARAQIDLKTENEQKSGKKQKPLEGKATYLLKRIGETKDWEIVQIIYNMK